jgi:hypothetical protein
MAVVVVVVVVVVSSSSSSSSSSSTVVCCRAYDFFVDLLVTISPLIMARKELFYRKCTFFGRWTSVR